MGQPKEPESHSSEQHRLTLGIAKDILPRFRPLLEQGFTVKVTVGQSIAEVLCVQLGVPEEYLRNRVQTVFLNGRAVDDETRAVVKDGDRVALSASMPGLAGATMRKGGFFSGLRAGISHRKSAVAAPQGTTGTITIKLFNMIAVEIGPLFLGRGIGISGKQLAAFWNELGDDFWRGVETAAVDARPCQVRQLPARDWGNDTIRLTLELD